MPRVAKRTVEPKPRRAPGIYGAGARLSNGGRVRRRVAGLAERPLARHLASVQAGPLWQPPKAAMSD